MKRTVTDSVRPEVTKRRVLGDDTEVLTLQLATTIVVACLYSSDGLGAIVFVVSLLKVVPPEERLERC